MSRQRTKKRIWHILLVVLAAVLVLAAAVCYEIRRSSTHPVVEELVWDSPKVQTPIRLCLLTDLHDSEFGEGNRELIDRIRECAPDLILVTGDVVDKSIESTRIAEDFLTGLTGIAPVYVSIGNHEITHEEDFGSDLRSVYESCGATVLDYTWEDVEVRDEKLRLGGLYGYCLSFKFGGESKDEEVGFLKTMEDTDRETVLLCHLPVCWHKSISDFDVDLVLAGHVHGGQMILPYIGGVYAPDYGWFPGRLTGIFPSTDEKKALILSAGLGSTEKIPRFFNPPMITMVTVE